MARLLVRAANIIVLLFTEYGETYDHQVSTVSLRSLPHCSIGPIDYIPSKPMQN